MSVNLSVSFTLHHFILRVGVSYLLQKCKGRKNKHEVIFWVYECVLSLLLVSVWFARALVCGLLQESYFSYKDARRFFKGHLFWLFVFNFVLFADFTVLSKSFKSRASFGKKNRQNLWRGEREAAGYLYSRCGVRKVTHVDSCLCLIWPFP